ncbi:MAG: ADP-ribosylglycohydrolase family protein [Spirochaetia bacterium]|nr:ADP-ribosylglycohydrolase family protein [Spirochaetia bacterium]
MTTSDYLNRLYAGFLGMNIGIRLGAPVEPSQWSSERIERFYGDIHGYIKTFKNFAADDDANGPVFFLRALNDLRQERELQSSDVAEAWLNYTREGVGMFWWGGYGVSTEHTAYLNLKSGVPAPMSGSIAMNGKTLAEQIGGQIFIDTWGLLFPGDCKKAAQYAKIAASVSHDGEALEGAAFMAAAIAKAFVSDDVSDIIDAALKEISSQSLYAKIVNAVKVFYTQHPDDWRLCLSYLQQNWGYDRYGGICHIIPNAGVCIMALLYGKTLSRGVEIATMAGWDTDCNAGNIGTILGVAGSLVSVEDHYRKPIGDFLALSGISGYLNIMDIPSYIKQVAALSYTVRNLPIAEETTCQEGVLDFDFSLPGSTHGFRVSNTHACSLSNQSGCLQMLYDRMVRPNATRLYYKPFYRRGDFDDERYMPVFSPTVYPSQRVSMRYRLEKFSGESVLLSAYVRNTSTSKLVVFTNEVVYDEDWHEVSFTIDKNHPDLKGAMIDEIGLLFEANSPVKNRDFGVLHLSHFSVAGLSCYTIDLAQQSREFASITPFSHNHGAWDLVQDERGNTWLDGMCLEHAEAMTGNYFSKDVQIQGSFICHSGTSSLMGIRVQGARRGYYGGFHNGSIGIFKHEGGVLKALIEQPRMLQLQTHYACSFKAEGSTLSFALNDEPLLQVEDDAYAYGMIGYAMYDRARVSFGNLDVEELR